MLGWMKLGPLEVKSAMNGAGFVPSNVLAGIKVAVGASLCAV